MEIWDVYDYERKKTGRTVVRGQGKVGGSEYHLTVHVIIFSSDGRMLIQQRTNDKAGWPGLWDVTAGGAAVAGESSAVAAERELFEELGIRMSFEGIRPHFTLGHKLGFGDCYIVNADITLEGLVLQPSEVQAADYASLEEIINMMNGGRFIPYHESFVRLLFDMRHGYGAHISDANK